MTTQLKPIRRTIHALFIALFAAVTSQAAVPATGSTSSTQFGDDKKTELMIRATAFALSSFENYQILVDHLPRKADRQYIQEHLGAGLRQPIHVRYLEYNILLLTVDGEQIPIEIKDLNRHHFAILKHDYFFDPNEPVERAIQKLSASFDHASLFEMLEPRANAVNWGKVARWALFYAYVVSAATLGVECMKSGRMANKQCIGASALWPVAAGFIGVGLAVLGYQETKNYVSDKVFELTDITCPKGDQPLMATVTDSKHGKMTLEMHYKPTGKPDHIDFKAVDGQFNSLYFKDDWSPDPDRSPIKANAFEARAANLVSEGAENLSKLCYGADSERALERYTKEKGRGMTVRPDPLDPTATIEKTVQ